MLPVVIAESVTTVLPLIDMLPILLDPLLLVRTMETPDPVIVADP